MCRPKAENAAWQRVKYPDICGTITRICCCTSGCTPQPRLPRSGRAADLQFWFVCWGPQPLVHPGPGLVSAHQQGSFCGTSHQVKLFLISGLFKHFWLKITLRNFDWVCSLRYKIFLFPTFSMTSSFDVLADNCCHCNCLAVYSYFNCMKQRNTNNEVAKSWSYC